MIFADIWNIRFIQEAKRARGQKSCLKHKIFTQLTKVKNLDVIAQNSESIISRSQTRQAIIQVLKYIQVAMQSRDFHGVKVFPIFGHSS